MITTEQELQPFSVPNFVVIKPKTDGWLDGQRDSVKVPLRELSDDVLHALCDQFREDVLAKARKDVP